MVHAAAEEHHHPAGKRRDTAHASASFVLVHAHMRQRGAKLRGVAACGEFKQRVSGLWMCWGCWQERKRDATCRGCRKSLSCESPGNGCRGQWRVRCHCYLCLHCLSHPQVARCLRSSRRCLPGGRGCESHSARPRQLQRQGAAVAKA